MCGALAAPAPRRHSNLGVFNLWLRICRCTQRIRGMQRTQGPPTVGTASPQRMTQNHMHS